MNCEVGACDDCMAEGHVGHKRKKLSSESEKLAEKIQIVLMDLETKGQEYKGNSDLFSALMEQNRVVILPEDDAEIKVFTDLLNKSHTNTTESKERLALWVKANIEPAQDKIFGFV